MGYKGIRPAVNVGLSVSRVGSAAQIICSLWCGTRGYLDKVNTKEILRFEALWLEHVKSTRASILNEIMTKKQITPEIEGALKSGMDEFLGMNEFEGKTA